MVESIARVRHIRITPQKARRVVDLIRGKNAQEARAILKFAPQAASEPVAKVIASAAANAQNNDGLDPSTLVVSEIFADEGPTAKRIRPRAQGRAFRIRKRTKRGDQGELAISFGSLDDLGALLDRLGITER